MSGAYFRASVRRALDLPPVWQRPRQRVPAPPVFHVVDGWAMPAPEPATAPEPKVAHVSSIAEVRARIDAKLAGDVAAVQCAAKVERIERRVQRQEEEQEQIGSRKDAKTQRDSTATACSPVEPPVEVGAGGSEAVQDKPAPTNAVRDRYARATDDVSGCPATLQSDSLARLSAARQAPPAPTPIPAPAPRPAPPLFATDGRTWCEQCERRATKFDAARCGSKFCKLKGR